MLSEDEDVAYGGFQQHVDRLCFLIVATSCSDREIDIERLHLRTQAMQLFPEKIHLYDWIYESRFRRLREQFRNSSNNLNAENRS
jgi:hypothetical protein